MSMDAVAVALLTELLRKPTGGVDWSGLTPNYVEGTSSDHPTTETEIVSITGAGYLTALTLYLSLQQSVGTTTMTVNLYIDGTLIYSWSLSSSDDSTPIIKSVSIDAIWRFNSEVKITAQYTSSPDSGSVSWSITTSQE